MLLFSAVTRSVGRHENSNLGGPLHMLSPTLSADRSMKQSSTQQREEEKDIMRMDV